MSSSMLLLFLRPPFMDEGRTASPCDRGDDEMTKRIKEDTSKG